LEIKKSEEGSFYEQPSLDKNILFKKLVFFFSRGKIFAAIFRIFYLNNKITIKIKIYYPGEFI
jgi:hypothetical protein